MSPMDYIMSVALVLVMAWSARGSRSGGAADRYENTAVASEGPGNRSFYLH